MKIIPKKTKIVTIIIFLAARLNVSLNIIFIPRYGMLAAAVITIISQFLAVILGYFQAQKYYFVNFEFKRVITLFAIAFTLHLANLVFDQIGLLEIFLKSIFCLSYPFILYFIKFYDTEEIMRTKSTLFKLKSRMVK